MDMDRLKTWVSNSSHMVALSATLAQKQATLTTINGVALPKVYHSIGKHVVTMQNLPADLAPFRDRIKQLESSMAAQPDSPQADEAGFAAKARRLAARASQAAADATAAVQLRGAYVTLGKQAVETYGERALPKALLEEYRSLATQRDGLKAELESLASVPGKGVLTPRRLALAGVVVCLLMGATVVRSATSWLLGGRPGLPRDVADEVARATADIGRGLDSMEEERVRDQARTEADPRTRDLQERGAALPQRERELRDRGTQAHKGPARTPTPEISNLRQGRPLLLVDHPAFVHLANNDYHNLLAFPSREFPHGVGSLGNAEPTAPKSLQDAIGAYKKAVAALQKRPVLASLGINESIGEGRYVANWQGQTCVFESHGTALDLGRGHHVPVTCTHVVSYTHGARTCTDHPYLVQAGEVTSDEVATRDKYAADLKDELAAVLRAGQWIVYFGVVDLPSDSSRLTESDVTTKVLLDDSLPRAKQLLQAVHKTATDTMTRDAPALCYALRCANRSMLEDALRRKHATDTRIEGRSERLVLPAAAALQWALWFRNPGSKEEQVGILECLAACGAQWDKQDDRGRTPLMHAILATQRHAVAYLCDHKPGVAKQDSEGRTALMIALTGWESMFEPLLALPGALGGVDRNGDNPLHYCNRYKHVPVLSMMKTLAEKGVSVSAANNDGDTPLHTLARAATRELSADFNDVRPWTEAVRFLVGKGGSGAAVNARGETPVGILTRAERHQMTVGFLFPVILNTDPKGQRGKHRTLVLNDASVLWVEDRGDHRTALLKRSLQGKEIARRTIEGDLLQTGGADAFHVRESSRGEVFCVVKRGKAVQVVALTDALEPKWESKPFYRIVNLAVQPDGAVVVLGGERFEEPSVPVRLDPRGTETWTARTTDMLSKGGKVHGTSGSSWRAAPNGVFALGFGVTGQPPTVVSFTGDGAELVRSQPFPDGSRAIEITGVLSDGSILVQNPADENEALLIGPGGAVRWRYPLGRVTGLCEPQTGGVAVVSRAGNQTRLSRIDQSGTLGWEVGLAGRGPGFVQEGAGGRLFASTESGDLLWTLDEKGRLLAVAEFLTSSGPRQQPRVFRDGTIVWPDETGTFMVGDSKTWPR